MMNVTRRVYVTLPETSPLTGSGIRAILSEMAKESILRIDLDNPQETLLEVMEAIEKEALLDLFDVDAVTLWRWSKGTPMKAPYQKQLWQLAVKLDIPAPCSRRKIRLRRK